MRARMGILLAKQTVKLRAVVTKNKPKQMLAASAKGTVPILVLDKIVIDESLEIMLWALAKNDPQDLLYNKHPNSLANMLALINLNDLEFIPCLEKYKYAKRHHDMSQLYYRMRCEEFIAKLEEYLNTHDFFMGEKPSVADYAILPFIRQFARVDRKWYLQAPYPRLRSWLNGFLQSPLFTRTMAKYPLWLDSNEEFVFGIY